MSGPKPHQPEGGASPSDEPPRQPPDIEYIASMLESLRQLAVGAERPFLAYLIGVALEEAKGEKGGGV